MTDTGQNILSFKGFQWAHVPLTIGAFHVFISLVGNALFALQMLVNKAMGISGKAGAFTLSQRGIYLVLVAIGVLTIAVALSMNKKWLAAKWSLGSIAVVGLIVYTPLRIQRSIETYLSFGRYSHSGTSSGIQEWLPSLVDTFLRVLNYLIPIVAFTLPAFAILVALIMDQKRPAAHDFVNTPPGK